MFQRLPASAVVFFSLTGSLLAQSLNLALSVPSPSALNASSGSSTMSTPIAAGPMQPTGFVAASSGGATDWALSSLGWWTDSGAASAYARLTLEGIVNGNAQCDGGPLDVILMLSSSVPTSVNLELRRYGVAPFGQPTPMTRVDVLDDGTLELSESSGSTSTQFAIPVGPTPVPVRLQVGVELVDVGTTIAEVSIDIRPARITTTSVLPGCQAIPFICVPHLDNHLGFEVPNYASGAWVAVFGLGAVPTYLGSHAPSPFGPLMPCVLMPTPDLVLLMAPAVTQRLPLPPTLGPLTLYGQAVTTGGSGLLTSSALQISVY